MDDTTDTPDPTEIEHDLVADGGEFNLLHCRDCGTYIYDAKDLSTHPECPPAARNDA